MSVTCNRAEGKLLAPHQLGARDHVKYGKQRYLSSDLIRSTYLSSLPPYLQVFRTTLNKLLLPDEPTLNSHRMLQEA